LKNEVVICWGNKLDYYQTETDLYVDKIALKRKYLDVTQNILGWT